jgi:hypothetical protein
MEILGIIVNQVVTMLGTSSYTSGAQLCNGAAAILNKKPITINNRPIIEIIEFSSPPPYGPIPMVENTRLNIDSKLVKPVNA